MPDTPERTIRVWADTVTKTTGRCRARTCRAAIWFAQTVGRGKMMPFDGARTPVRTDVEAETGRIIWELAAAQVHFVTCRARPAPPPTRPIPARRDWHDRDDD